MIASGLLQRNINLNLTNLLRDIMQCWWPKLKRNTYRLIVEFWETSYSSCKKNEYSENSDIIGFSLQLAASIILC